MIAAESLVEVPTTERGLVALQWVEDGKVIVEYGYKARVGFLRRNTGGFGPPWVKCKVMHSAIHARLWKMAIDRGCL